VKHADKLRCQFKRPRLLCLLANILVSLDAYTIPHSSERRLNGQEVKPFKAEKALHFIHL